eukprot:5948151-Prymnesium_polylepis.1
MFVWTCIACGMRLVLPAVRREPQRASARGRAQTRRETRPRPRRAAARGVVLVGESDRVSGLKVASWCYCEQKNPQFRIRVRSEPSPASCSTLYYYLRLYTRNRSVRRPGRA